MPVGDQSSTWRKTKGKKNCFPLNPGSLKSKTRNNPGARATQSGKNNLKALNPRKRFQTERSYFGAFCLDPTNGVSIKPLKVTLLAGEQKATEFSSGMSLRTQFPARAPVWSWPTGTSGQTCRERPVLFLSSFLACARVFCLSSFFFWGGGCAKMASFCGQVRTES